MSQFQEALKQDREEKYCQDILICCMTSEKNTDRRERINTVLANHMAVIYYSDHEDLSQRVMQVSTRTDYHSNEEKHINCINQVIELQLPFEWYFFCDDDTFVNPKNLIEFTKTTKHNKIYGLVYDEVGNPTNPIFAKLKPGFVYLSGGAGYLVHRNILQEKRQFKNFDTGYSDVSFGLNFDDPDIFVNSYRMHASAPSHYSHTVEEIQKSISYHYIKDGELHASIMSALGGMLKA